MIEGLKTLNDIRKAFEEGKILPTAWLGDSVSRLDTFSKYASQCNSVTEFGVYTGSSTLGFLLGKPSKMTSYDITDTNFSILPAIQNITKTENINYQFIKGNSLEVEIEFTDLLFIDTVHKKRHVLSELNKHHSKVKKYILLHDTTAFPEVFEGIKIFLETNKNWYIDYQCENGNGLVVLKNTNANVS